MTMETETRKIMTRMGALMRASYLRHEPKKYIENYDKIIRAAVADGMWEKNNPRASSPIELPPMEGLETLEAAKKRAYVLYRDIVMLHGAEEANKIFKGLADRGGMSKMTKADLAKSDSEMILMILDDMPKPNVMELARQLADDGWGTVTTVDHRIREARRKRKADISKGTWDGPPLWNEKLNSYAHRKGMIKI
jgi:hypothetical protein